MKTKYQLDVYEIAYEGCQPLSHRKRFNSLWLRRAFMDALCNRYVGTEYCSTTYLTGDAK